jgi:hypothetical protein
MNTTAKIIIAVLIFLVTFFGIYSYIKAKENDRLYTLLLEEQQISLQEKERASQLSAQASRSAAQAIESAAIAELEKKRTSAVVKELMECERMRK